jgi:hypothetical protein
MRITLEQMQSKSLMKMRINVYYIDIFFIASREFLIVNNFFLCDNQRNLSAEIVFCEI